mgnify:CR=1 FL=1
MPVKVLIVEDNPVARSFLCRVVRESFSDVIAITEAGDLESARREVARTLRMDPTYTVKRFISPNLYRDKTVMDRCAEVLRSAGMPESD